MYRLWLVVHLAPSAIECLVHQPTARIENAGGGLTSGRGKRHVRKPIARTGDHINILSEPSAFGSDNSMLRNSANVDVRAGVVREVDTMSNAQPRFLHGVKPVWSEDVGEAVGAKPNDFRPVY